MHGWLRMITKNNMKCNQDSSHPGKLENKLLIFLQGKFQGSWFTKKGKWFCYHVSFHSNSIFTGDWLHEPVRLEIGISKYQRILKRHQGKLKEFLMSWNAGNPHNVYSERDCRRNCSALQWFHAKGKCTKVIFKGVFYKCYVKWKPFQTFYQFVNVETCFLVLPFGSSHSVRDKTTLHK